MKVPKKDVWIVAAVVLLFVVASVAYRALSRQYTPDSVPLPSPADSGGTVSTPADLPVAADFTVYDADGNEVRLADLIGEPIIINFWASWCPPCRAELPAFDAAYRSYGGAIRFLMVNLTDGAQETKASANALIEESGYTFPVYYDTTGSAVSAYRLYSIPQTVGVNADGQVVRSWVGMMSEEALASLIDELLPN